jgi:hypothetical protein
MDALLDLKSEMTKATDDGTRKDVASRMEPHVATLMSAVDSLSGASVSDFPIPPSQSQTPGAEYLVKVEVDGSPADYSEFWVFGSTAQAPGSMTGGTPTTSAGSPGTSGKATLAPGSPTLASGEAPETEGVAGVVGDAAGLSSSGTIGRLGGATATPSMAGGELASPAGVDAPPAAEAPPQSVDMSGQPDKGAAAATAIVAKGVVDRIASEGGTLGGLDGGSGSGPNFAVLLVGVVVLAGVAVFMKGRM